MKIKLFVLGILAFLGFFSIASGNLDTDVSDHRKEKTDSFFLSDEEKRIAESLAHFATSYMELLDKNRFTDFAFQQMLEAVKSNPDSKLPVSILTSQWYNRNEYQKWADNLYPIAKENPKSVSLNLVAATGLMVADRYNDAEEILSQTYTHVRKIPNDKKDFKEYRNLIIYLLNIYAKNGKFDEGEDLYEDAVKVPGMAEDFDFRRTSAIFFSSAFEFPSDSFWASWRKKRYKNKSNENINIVTELWKKKIEQDFAHKEDFIPGVGEMSPLIELMNQKNMFEQSENVIFETLLYDPNNLQSLAFLAKIYSDEKMHELAIRLWKKILEKNPDEFYFWYQLGHDELATQDYESAIEAFRKCLAFRAGYLPAEYQLGISYFRMPDYKNAINQFEKIMIPEAKYLQALCYAKEKKYADTIKYLLESEKLAIEMKSEKLLDKPFYLTLATYYEKNGDFDKSVDILKKLISEANDDPELLNFLGYIYADHNTNLDEAEQLISKALSKDPENPAYLDSMAWVLYRLGKYKKAREYIDMAIENDAPVPDGVISDHAGDIYNALGDKEIAIFHWKNAIGTSSEELDREKVILKIKALEGAEP